MMPKLLMTIALLALAGQSWEGSVLGLAHADEQQSKSLPSREDFIKWLGPGEGERGLSVAAGASATADRNQIEAVLFRFGSAELSADAKAVLNVMASAIQSDRLRPYHYRVVGHTDAVGSDESNLLLSKRRAQSVGSYLTAMGIAPERLDTDGVGESELADPQNPDSAANRRVVFYLVQ